MSHIAQKPLFLAKRLKHDNSGNATSGAGRPGVARVTCDVRGIDAPLVKEDYARLPVMRTQLFFASY
jgi:hypothetical protein